ncbi:hypothetical protein [Pseudoalteromonas luteoviolacea]|uniref:Uncharacterized protein n=1 Tax=Pseudoalteromonas luteoviolacea DSM 6061 TaxID=1365250 RepID=A0A166VWI4_9GAMM|nr:hypothetical protein [Pseudoalteromonas luteoviolacea]KZN33951.1 hypothetical protein N475_19595 [Pseudoalteromonas luteoviolacea DSM 6061]KZN54005.1 hypothetical protein N474_18580 [Pseudoalteromonas luteoviolacea CPMOR-2]MBE0385818.1 hypothetical protein [Pseudoalteromonas luteoviolacea DSM 6061]TQF70744.1 hypothetical protein FLM44_06555 [Pseudoalteromonas luteoviolacea]
MTPEAMTDLTITLLLLLVSLGMVFQGKILRATKMDTPAKNAEKLHKRGGMLLTCGSIVAVIQVFKLGSFLF